MSAVKAGSDLSWSNLSGSNLSWSSHDLLAEVLRRAAGDNIQHRMIAGLLLVSREWCWDEFLAVEGVDNEWALRELAKWIQPSDSHPECLDKYREKTPTNESQANEETNHNPPA